jgi:hypothetical protein
VNSRLHQTQWGFPTSSGSETLVRVSEKEEIAVPKVASHKLR